MLFEEWFNSEAFETVGAIEGSFSAVDATMFNQSNRFFEPSIANFALVGRILRMGSLVLKQAGRLVEDFAADLANVLNLSRVDILVPTKGTQQGIRIATVATHVTLHPIDDDDFG